MPEMPPPITTIRFAAALRSSNGISISRLRYTLPTQHTVEQIKLSHLLSFFDPWASPPRKPIQMPRDNAYIDDETVALPPSRGRAALKSSSHGQRRMTTTLKANETDWPEL